MILAVAVLFLSSGMHDDDADGILDNDDNCPDVANPTQDDFDHDKLGNECDPEPDNDKID